MYAPYFFTCLYNIIQEGTRNFNQSFRAVDSLSKLSCKLPVGPLEQYAAYCPFSLFSIVKNLPCINGDYSHRNIKLGVPKVISSSSCDHPQFCQPALPRTRDSP